MEKELCMLYFLNPVQKKFEQELIEIVEKGNHDTSIIKSVVEFKNWARLPNRKTPTLIVTDISNQEEAFNSIYSILSEAYILCVNEKAVEDFDNEKGNMIYAFRTYDDVLSFLLNYSDIITPLAPPEERIKKPIVVEQSPLPIPSPESLEIEGKRMSTDDLDPHVYRGQGDPFFEPHPSVHMITEFRQEKPTEFVQSESNPTNHDNQLDVEGLQAIQVEGFSEPFIENQEAVPLRSREIQQQMFTRRSREGHKKIGIWSPLHRTGVTSLTMNFAIFLSHQKYDVTVLEGLTSHYTMKDWLKRYVDIPKDWVSYAKAIQTDGDASYARWYYETILFLPLDKEDPQYNWDDKTLEIYMTTTELSDITLIDLPTGEMQPYTKKSLQYLDQLWVVVDDAIQETLSWTDYIMTLKKELKCPIFLVFNKHYSFSQSHEFAKKLKIPVIACVPALHEEAMRNYYENIPLYLKEDTKEMLDKPFIALATQVFDRKFIFEENDVDALIPTWSDKIWKPIRSIFRPLKNY